MKDDIQCLAYIKAMQKLLKLEISYINYDNLVEQFLYIENMALLLIEFSLKQNYLTALGQ